MAGITGIIVDELRNDKQVSIWPYIGETGLKMYLSGQETSRGFSTFQDG